MRVAITRRWPAVAQAEAIRRFDAQTNDPDLPLTAAELKALAASCDVLCPTVTDRVDSDVLDGATCRLIANYGVGFSHIDLDAARQRGIAVTNTPDVLTDATAEIALMLMLMVCRRASEGERELRAGQWVGWRPTHLLGSLLTGKTLGIIGLGRIGEAVARRASAGFDMTVLHCNPRPRSSPYSAQVDLDELLARSDVVSLHCPGGEANRHLIDAAALTRMQQHAVLINTARGEVVEEAALASALDAGEIAGAGLDVYSAEPAVPSSLLNRNDITLLPHLGSGAEETRNAMGLRVLANVDAFLSAKPLPDPVL